MQNKVKLKLKLVKFHGYGLVEFLHDAFWGSSFLLQGLKCLSSQRPSLVLAFSLCLAMRYVGLFQALRLWGQAIGERGERKKEESL